MGLISGKKEVTLSRLIPVFLFFPLLISTHRIELFYGRTLESPVLKIEGNQIVLQDTVISKNDVKSIVFSEGEVKAEKKQLPEDVKKILQEAEEARKKYGDYEGVVLIDDGIYNLLPDGIRFYRYHFAGLILKDTRRNWGTFVRYFDEDAERLKIISARVIKPNGRTIPLDLNKITVTKPRQGMEFFGKGKIVTFTFPSVEVGDIVEYEYTEEIFNPWDRNVFNPNWYFGSDDPVVFSRIKIILPEGKKLYYKLFNAPDVKVDSTQTDSGMIYTFVNHDAIPPVEEIYMPPKEEYLPRLVAGVMKDWDYLFNWYSNFQKNRMIVTPEIKVLADSLTNGATTHEEKTARLYHWVQQNIRYISIKGSASSGVSGHRADVTLKNGYGDCTDKAILFSTLLKAVGIECYPVYLHTNDGPDLVKEIPSFWGNHAIVEVFPENGPPYFLDPVSTYSRYPSFASMDHGMHAICAMKKKIDFIKVPPPDMNLRNYTYEIFITPDGTADVSFTSRYTGDYEAGIRGYWIRLKERERKMTFTRMVSDVSPDAQLLEYNLENLEDISKPLIMHIRYRLPNFLEKAGDLYILKLPEIDRRYTRRELALSDRRYPLVYMTSEEIKHTFKIILPKNWKVEYVPEKRKVKYHEYEYSGYYQIKGDTLLFKDDFRRYGRKIPVEHYKKYRRYMNAMLKFVKMPVIISTGGEE